MRLLKISAMLVLSTIVCDAAIAAPKQQPKGPGSGGISLKELPAGNVIRRGEQIVNGLSWPAWPELKVTWHKIFANQPVNVALIVARSVTDQPLPANVTRLAETLNVADGISSVVLTRPENLECGKNYQYYVELLDRGAYAYSPALRLECTFGMHAIPQKSKHGQNEYLIFLGNEGPGHMPIGSRIIMTYNVPAGTTVTAGRGEGFQVDGAPSSWSTTPSLAGWSTPVTSTTGVVGPATLKIIYTVRVDGMPGNPGGRIVAYYVRMTSTPPGKFCVNVELEMSGAATPLSSLFPNPRCSQN